MDTEVEEKRGPGRPPNPKPEQISMSHEQYQTLISTLIAEARKPVIDPIKEKQALRMKEHNKALAKDNYNVLINRFRGCNHMQSPGSILTGCCCVAWATQSDGHVRGVCQHCNTLFSPLRDECLSEEIHQMYNVLRRLPTHPGGQVSYTFQQA